MGVMGIEEIRRGDPVKSQNKLRHIYQDMHERDTDAERIRLRKKVAVGRVGPLEAKRY